MATPADAISVLETLHLLDHEHTTFAEGVAEGRYAFWLGSGVSRGVVPGLDGVMQKVLEHLKARIDDGDPDGRFHDAFTEVLRIAQLTEVEQRRLDTDQPVSDWVDRKLIIKRLAEHYAKVLKIRVAGEDPDYLLWDAADVRETYGAPQSPDAEHFCLAILGMEGAMRDMVSANWDGLVEAAFEELDGGAATYLSVAVHGEDLREPRLRVRLLKFHGCAVRAKRDPATYRGTLVARSPQITSWAVASYAAAMRNEITNLATTTPTLMVGLSAQDTDIQAMFASATATLQWTWPGPLPALVFAEDQLGDDQLDILEIAYGTDFDNHRNEIANEALVRAFAKPLLVALVLDVLARKARTLIAKVDAPHLAEGDLGLLADGIGELRDLSGGAAGAGSADFVRGFIEKVGRFASLFQHGTEPGAPRTYRPLTMGPVSQLAVDPSLPTNGVREMAAALGLLGCGVRANGWRVAQDATATGAHGALRISGRRERAVFFAATNAAAIELRRNGTVPATDRSAIVVHSDDPGEAQRRSPSGPPGRTGVTNVLDVRMREMLREATSFRDLERRFRLATGLT